MCLARGSGSLLHQIRHLLRLPAGPLVAGPRSSDTGPPMTLGNMREQAWLKAQHARHTRKARRALSQTGHRRSRDG
jgi:hypothetical protein